MTYYIAVVEVVAAVKVAAVVEVVAAVKVAVVVAVVVAVAEELYSQMYQTLLFVLKLEQY